MSVEVRLPLLADAMTEARIGAWLKREGDSVASGEPIVEVETDKTNVEIEAPASGVIAQILVPAGSDSVMVGALLATIIEAYESPALSGGAARLTAGHPIMPVTAAPRPALIGAVQHEPGLHDADVAESNERGVNASVVARKIAKLAGLDLAAIRPLNGSRITKADLDVALRMHEPAALPLVAPSFAERAPAVPVPLSSGPFEDRPLSAMRRVAAQRLLQAKQTVPHFYLHSECRVDALLELRSRWNARGNGTKITVTDLLVFAASRALRRAPQANSAWIETGVRVFENVDIAVAVNTPAGLIAPVVRECGRKNIMTISRELAVLAERARAGALKPDEYSGGTFTISNLGMFGVTSIVPIVNLPHACILGVGAIESRPVVSDGAIVPGKVVTCTLAADHRAIDGAGGAEFMSELRRLLEDPLAMTLEA